MKKGKPAKKYSQAGRLHNVIRLLETRQCLSLNELAEEFGVDRRTIHRDINAIEEAGYPLTCHWEDGRKMYRFLTKSRNIPPITFTLPQLMSLYLLRSLGEQLNRTPFKAEMDELFASITSVLPHRYAAHLERIARISLPLAHGARDYSAAASQLKGIERALLYQFRITMTYAKKAQDQGESYVVDPYTLIFHRGGMYLLGFAHNRNDMRLFALERVRGVEVMRQRFEIPDSYRPEEHFKEAFGLVHGATVKVTVRFSPEIAHSVRDRIWMNGQTITSLADGGVLLEFEAGGDKEIVSWILSYGRYAEVLEPESLRREVGQHVREMAFRYQQAVSEKLV